ncbi:MAG: hypothetical protein QM492_05785 [Rhodobacterales bacterium]
MPHIDLPPKYPAQRIGDVRKMRWSDIEDGGINVRQGKTSKGLWIGSGRSSRYLKEILNA